eukprot:gene29361-36558_t
MAYGEVSTEQVSLTQNLVLVSDLGADTGSATWAVADVTPPEITVFGGTSLTVPQVPDAYVELGATGFDQQDGCLVVEIEGASELDTLVATGDGPAHKVVYSAVDAAGNSRTVTRLVTVASSCKPPSFPCPQLEGVVCATCLPDVPCLCLSPITIGSDNTVDSDGTVAARAPGGFVPHVDTRDPSLSMRGDGQLGQTPDGTTVMYDYLEVGWPYEDGGATAWDATEGNVTAHVSRFGVAAISSSTVAFSDLDMNQFEDGAFSEAFHSQFEAQESTSDLRVPLPPPWQIAAAAGVDTEAVIVTGIVAASIVITSEVIFPSGLEVAAVAHFEKALMDDPGGIFTDPDFMAYGEVSTEQVDYTNWLVAAAAGYGFSVGVRIISVEAVGGELTVTSMVFFPVDQRSAASTFSDALLTSGTSGIPSTW